jgi:hypothetical protein
MKPVEPIGLGVYLEIARDLAAGRVTVNGEPGHHRPRPREDHRLLNDLCPILLLRM